MVINRCVEQGIYVVLILSFHKEHSPLRSTQLSTLLSVSDSYLKKILRKLVLAGIVTSSTGKEGGFQLARPIDQITVYDVYSALEGRECNLKLAGIGSRIHVHGKDFATEEQKVKSAFEKANAAFRNELCKLTISELAGVNSSQKRRPLASKEKLLARHRHIDLGTLINQQAQMQN